MNFTYIQIQTVKKKKKKEEHLEDNYGNVNIDLLVIKEFCIIIWDRIIV